MKQILIAGLATLIATPMTAMAYEAGDFIVRAGATQVQPKDDYDPDGVGPNRNAQLGLNLVYMATDNIGVELLAATPFKHDIQIEGAGGTVTDIGSTKHLPPTISLQYYIKNSTIVTPYFGAGVNYTVFFDEKIDGIGDIELENSWGLAVQAGVDIALADNVGINFDIRQIDIDTEVEDNSAVDGIDVNIDPVVYSVTAFFKF